MQLAKTSSQHTPNQQHTQLSEYSTNDQMKIQTAALQNLISKIKHDNKHIQQLLDMDEHKFKLLNDKYMKLGDTEDEDDEDDEEEEDYPSTYICIKDPMKTVDDLIKIGKLYEKYKDDDDTYFNIDLYAVHKLIEPLKLLNKMVGLNQVKSAIVKQITFYIQHLENKNNDFLHSVFYGNPGVGKTEIGHIIANIYCSLGFLKTNRVISVHAEDCIGCYVGQTAIKTRAILNKSIGGVLIIDEAYALGNKDGKSYVDDFVNTLVPFLTEHRSDFVCILMGYKDDIEETLFSRNKGLRRRFPNIYEINDYSMTELRDILIIKIDEYGWYYDNDAVPIKLFEKNKEYFKENGGSIENLFKDIKTAHAERVLYFSPEKKKTINLQDFQSGLDSYCKMVKSYQTKKTNSYDQMYL